MCWWVCGACLLGVALWFGRRGARFLALSCVLALAGQAWAVWQVVAAGRLEAQINQMVPGVVLCVRGRAFSVGEATAEDDEGDRFAPSTQRFRVQGFAPEGAWGQTQIELNVFWVRAEDERVTVEEGDQVQVCGPWQPPFGFFNPGAGAGWPQVALKAAVGSMRATTVRVQAQASMVWPWKLAAQVRHALSQTFAVASADRAAFLRATVLGERAAVSPEVELGFKAAGATHALSVSGLHLAAVAALFFVGLRWLLLRSWRFAMFVSVRPWAAALSIPTVVFYTLVTGEAVATWRSALMASCLFAAYALRRAPSLSASLAFATLVVVAQSPFWLLDVSFQLSVLSVLGLAAFAGRLSPKATVELLWWRRVWVWFGKAMAATAAAGLITAPLVAYHFGEVTPAAPLGNIVLTPLVELVVVPLGLLGALFAAAVPSLAAVVLWPASAGAGLTLWVASQFAHAAPVWHVNALGAWATAALTLAAAASLGAWVAQRNARRKLSLISAVLCLFAMVAWAHRWWRNEHRQELRVTFLDVGQGDAAVVQGPHNFVAVVDGGGLSDSFDTGARLVTPFLRRQGISHISLVVLSHPHPDHALGLFAVLQNFGVDELWMPVSGEGPAHDGAFIRNLRQTAALRGTRVVEPHRIVRGGVTVEPFGPWDGDHIAAPPGLSVNDASLSVRFAFADHAVFFAGDLEGPGETELAEGARSLARAPRSDVLKVPHHGSRTSSSEELFECVAPALAVVSAGRGNRFGFPHGEVLHRYEQHKVGVLRTDRDGAVQLSWPAQGRVEATCTRGFCGGM